MSHSHKASQPCRLWTRLGRYLSLLFEPPTCYQSDLCIRLVEAVPLYDFTGTSIMSVNNERATSAAAKRVVSPGLS